MQEGQAWQKFVTIIKTNMKNIPSIIETYSECNCEPKRESLDEVYHYEVGKGEVVIIHKWVRFPNYDFMFGTPHPDSPRFDREYGFFAFRKKDGDNASVWSIYVDQDELEEMMKGFARVMDVSHATRHRDWAIRSATKAEENADS